MTGDGALAARGPWVLVLDVGSSSARAWLFDRAAHGHDPGPGARQRYRWRVDPPGVMETEASALLDGALAALDAAVAEARRGGARIEAVAVTTFWHSLLGVDEDGAPLTPVFAWGDSRAADDALRLAPEMNEDAVHRRTGCFLHPSYPSVKLAWLRRTDPARFRRVAGWISFGEHLEYALFGRRRCSLSMASGTGLLDVHRLRWDPEWLERLGLAEGHLSPLVDTDEPLRGLRQEFAARWPELAETPWFPAVGDGACASVGSGATEPGSLAVTIGTSAAVRAVWEGDDVVVPPGLWCYRLDGRRWVVGEALSNGGNGPAWLRRLLQLPPQPQTEAAAAAMEPDGHGLTVLPYLLRERGPGWRREFGGDLVGLTAATTPPEVARAWMEAIAYRIARGCARLEATLGPARRVFASGGALEGSPTWAAILADVLDREVVLPLAPEATARGAALVAMERLGRAPDLMDVPSEPPVRYRPDPGRHAVFQAAMRRQEALEQALAAWRAGPID